MASKLLPVSRASRLLRQLPTTQYRSFSAAPQRYSESLAVVRIPVQTQTPLAMTGFNCRPCAGNKGNWLTKNFSTAPEQAEQQPVPPVQVYRSEPQARR